MCEEADRWVATGAVIPGVICHGEQHELVASGDVELKDGGHKADAHWRAFSVFSSVFLPKASTGAKPPSRFRWQGGTGTIEVSHEPSGGKDSAGFASSANGFAS